MLPSKISENYRPNFDSHVVSCVADWFAFALDASDTGEKLNFACPIWLIGGSSRPVFGLAFAPQRGAVRRSGAGGESQSGRCPARHSEFCEVQRERVRRISRGTCGARSTPRQGNGPAVLGPR